MSDTLASALWLIVTVAGYAGVRIVQRRVGRWWAGPAIVLPPLLIAATLLTGTDYAIFNRFNSFLTLLLGPTIVAFACPVWEYRATIRRHGVVLMTCVVVGSLLSLASGYALAQLFAIPELLQQSLLPRAMTSPFAMPFAAQIGGDASLAALFVIVVGILGGFLGALMLRLPVASPVAKGLMFGISAHGVGTAYARELGREEGAVAALAMVMMGLVNISGLALFMLFSG